MKYGLLVYPHNANNIFNIGDYVQSIAARQFLPQVDCFLNREQLNEPIIDETKLILNGWFMHNPESWPPAEKLEPLFVAFHINKLAADKMLSRVGIEYLKKHQPIGCRDYYTVDLLKSKGVEAFFSGCLTLTLGESYHHEEEDGAQIYITDLNSLLKKNFSFIIRCFRTLLLKKPLLNRIRTRMNQCGAHRSMRSIAAVYETYQKVIADEVFLQANYIDQEIEDTFSSEDDKFEYADALLKKYSKARYVITSRIHCALPCLAMGTPVVFVNNDLLGEVHNCRLNGLRELFHTIEITNNGISLNLPGEQKLTLESSFKNNKDYIEFSDVLKQACTNFCR